MRIPQPLGVKGSLKWMQRAVNDWPEFLQPSALPALTWVSPLVQDEFAEYRDAGFLDRLGLSHLAPQLGEFWPRRGPQWDGLASFDEGVVLAEAKAHLAEFVSPPSQAGSASAQRIAKAFASVQTDLGARPANWDRVYFQYANRLAHLWWLRSQGINAHLVLIAFLNDAQMPGLATSADWLAAYSDAEMTLGLPVAHALTPFIHHLFVDTAKLA